MKAEVRGFSHQPSAMVKWENLGAARAEKKILSPLPLKGESYKFKVESE